ncbi:hypothetical protein NVP1007O_05 [Vibrio phage 1.007.O._10N.261.55.F9]|nr:hypothetical protein NVP1007O_05 [Vibrio phage 1.007.O._10N.261.55.F9]
MKHKHYEMIVAKAANVDLVVLIKSKVNNRWEVLDSVCIPSFYEDTEYFLCLPKHNEKGQCIHWLNGGDVVVKDYPDDKIERVLLASGYSNWHEASVFMCERTGIRIKPKKEKRWIGIHPLGATTPLCKTENLASNIVLHQLISIDMPFYEWQFIEIEVEV